MKNYLKVVAFALAWAGISGNAYSAPAGLPAASFSFSLGADFTSPGSRDVFRASSTHSNRLGLAVPSSTTAVTPSRGEQPAGLLATGQDISAFGNPGRNGDAGVSANASRDIEHRNAGVILASASVTDGYSGFQLYGTAVGTRGEDYQVAANTGHVSEPKTFALVLAGLLLMGSIVRRRIDHG